MGFPHQLFAFALLLPLASCASLIYENCRQNFTSNSIMQHNIQKTIFDMVANATSNGYATSTIGDGTNTIYGLTNCRGDLTAKDCADCLTAAANQLHASCPDSAESQIWYDVCSIRCNNVNFLGTPETDDYKAWYSGKDAADPKAFDTALWQLLEWVKLAAESGTKKFGIGKMSLDANTTIYGMAQCTQDLGESACKQCLEKMTSLMSTNCEHRIGCVYLCTSCGLRYEINNFLFAGSIPVYPGNAAAPAPAPSAQNKQ